MFEQLIAIVVSCIVVNESNRNSQRDYKTKGSVVHLLSCSLLLQDFPSLLTSRCRWWVQLITYLLVARGTSSEWGRVTCFVYKLILVNNGDCGAEFWVLLKRHGKRVEFFGSSKLPVGRKSGITGGIDAKVFTVAVVSCGIHWRWQWSFSVCFRLLSQRRLCWLW